MQQIVGSSSPDMDLIKLGCVFFMILEFFKGSRKSILSHLVHGVELFNRTGHGQESNSYDFMADTILSRMGLLQCLYGRPRKAHFPSSYRTSSHVRNHHLQTFQNLEEARDALVVLAASVLDFVGRVFYSAEPSSDNDFSEQEALSSRLQQWSNLARTLLTGLQNRTDERSKNSSDSVAIATVFLATATDQSEISYDHHINAFRFIVDTAVDIAHEIRVSESAPRLFSFDPGLILCLFFTAIKCRDRDIRRKTVAMLRLVPAREGMWDATEAALVAEEAVRWEEGSMVGSSGGCLPVIPDTARIYDTDLEECVDNKQSVLRIKFRYKANACFQDAIVFVDLPATDKRKSPR
ncbi:uncharacterized protein PAC_00267 [Phialocephala subalpina]|uniref:Uncharacterized protein n=1 Tax=Phialocephala subalpina TaxID=576137 RepID=A0A1L7WC88_9HELO|nr:uncharacterized protein PAC_00267 [Phialocephala subalpina]